MTAVVWAAVPLLAVVAVDDLRHRRIHNRDVGALSLVTAVVVAASAIDQGDHVVAWAMLGATLAAVPLLIAAVMEPGRMGGGDVKLAAVIGALLGPVSPWLSLATVAGALVLTLVGMTMRSARDAPLAPALAVSAVAALLLSAGL